MISPRTGSRARAQHSARGFVVFSLAASLIIAPQLTAVSPASATIKGADTTDVEAGAVELSIAAGVHGVIQPDSAFTTTVTINNGTDDELSTGHVTVALNTTPLTDAAALTSWLDSGAASGTFAPLSTEESEAVPATDSATASVFTPAPSLVDLKSGVYPIRAELTGATTDDIQDPSLTTQSLTANSVLIVDSATETQVGVLVPITATPEDGALLTADELAALTAPDGALTAQLDGVAGTSAVLAVDPLIPAAIRVLGTAAPLSASEWLTRLETLPNERFALQDGDADATVQAHAEFPELLAPLSLDSFLNEANFVEAEGSETPSPAPSPTPAEPVLPTNEELTQLRSAEPGVLWPLGDVDTATLTTFDAYLEADVTTVVPSTSIAAYTGARAEVDGNDLLVTDAAASALFSDAAAAADDADREADIVAGIAHLSLSRASSTAPQTSLLLGLDRNETRSSAALRETILSLSMIGDPVALDALRSAVPASATLNAEPSETAAARVAMLNDLLSDEVRLTAFASILDDPLLLLSPERLEVLRLIGVGVADEYADATAEHRTVTTATMNAVGVQQPSPIQLFTAAAPLPVWVRNDLPWPVNVNLSATPSDARLDVQPTIEVLAQPASNTRVKVPVSARVGSGSLTVRFSLTSPTGVHIGVDQSANVTVRAEWENIGLGILGSLIVLLLALGIVRTVLRRRKDRSESDAGSSSDTGAEEVTGE